MNKFNEILENKKYSNISRYVSKNAIVKEAVKNNKYIAVIKNENSITSLRTVISENKINVTISRNGKVLEKYSNDYETDNDIDREMKTAICTYNELDDIEDFEIDSDEDEEIVLTEEEPEGSKFTSIEMGLTSIKDAIKSVADDTKEISDMTSDVEMITVIMDIANDLYSSVLDVEDALETYKELKGEDSLDSDE